MNVAMRRWAVGGMKCTGGRGLGHEDADCGDVTMKRERSRRKDAQVDYLIYEARTNPTERCSGGRVHVIVKICLDGGSLRVK